MSTFRVQTLRAAALFICIISSAFADSASHAGSAERFLQLANADRLAVPVYAQVQQMFAQRFAEAQAPDTKKALLERYQAQANTALDKATRVGQAEAGSGRFVHQPVLRNGTESADRFL